MLTKFFYGLNWKYGSRLMLATLVAYLVVHSLHLSEGYWALYAVITCTNPTKGLSIQRSIHRLTGTIFGMCIGIIAVLFLPKNIITTDIILIVFIAIAIYSKAWGYGYYILAATIVTIFMMCMLFPGDWQIAITRLTMTLIGLAIAVGASLFLWPTQNRKNLPDSLLMANKNVEKYLTSVFDKKPGSVLGSVDSPESLIQASQNIKLTKYETISNNYVLYEDQIDILTKIYLLSQILSLYQLRKKPPLELLNIIASATKTSKSIPMLFNNYKLSLYKKTLKDITDLYQETYNLRSKAAADPQIPSTTLSDHINLMLQLQSIKSLLILLKQRDEISIRD